MTTSEKLFGAGELAPSNAAWGRMLGLTRQTIGERKKRPGLITLDELAQCCHCSRSAFEKKFRRIFDVSPGKYLLNLRLAEAENRLRNTRDSCAQIAAAVGFANQFVFSRLFKRHYGISPRDYRKWKIFC